MRHFTQLRQCVASGFASIATERRKKKEMKYTKKI